jgi:integrase
MRRKNRHAGRSHYYVQRFAIKYNASLHLIMRHPLNSHFFILTIKHNATTGPIRAQMALDWACTFSPGRGAAGQVNRLKVVRRFLSYLQAAIPETEIPALGLLGNIRRPKPHLYSQQQLERLIEAAWLLKPSGSLRSHTYATMIGLIASTGLRVGEAIRLTLSDVHIQTDQPPSEFRKKEKCARSSESLPTGLLCNQYNQECDGKFAIRIRAKFRADWT